ncbi:Class II aaRS and biotin synthetase [Venustampulla echinocandica]|uniref:lysine--tRNA ligase n=1 Tax=Venustampulla echinocandica TaxID=2656787 RepID=A0A370TEN2_9HELO|nr:Class II aaRS and biotin synthetase [Venustampulla echinocandica]RDL33139.1 Class II aaRS and biotin synthetase [Venustampulla echinocandica]
MSSASGLRFLRPYLCKDLNVSRNAAYIRFFSQTRCLKVFEGKQRRLKKDPASKASKASKASAIGDTNDRIEKLKAVGALRWPRIEGDALAVSIPEFHRRYGKELKPGEKRTGETVLVRGRITSVRVFGSSLVFVDIVEDGHRVQGVCNFSEIGIFNSLDKKQFELFVKTARRGDYISMVGHPYVTKNTKGELSVACSDLPKILSPCLHTQPAKMEDAEARVRNRHVDLLVNPHSADTFRVRSKIIQYIRDFLLKDDFLEVQTPIIADVAGGAIAKPFTTSATEFPEKAMALRIAPELWLKRLVIGGMNRVFEIGPAFRNEGLDLTHNPEFTTCEFYKSFASLDDLMAMTEQMVVGIAQHVTELRETTLLALPALDTSLHTAPFKRLEFIPAIEEALGQKLPDLADDSATEDIIAIFKHKSITVPALSTLPRLLDKLASIYLEPHCEAPTFITHHPACMAPLSKSFVDSSTNQVVSARAELFIQKREVANMYEEENSPFEQRAKFVEQGKWRDHENPAHVDESYLEALEWGLPPTGGWGCGIDRLVMLFSGATRISDVLPFGNLRNVVNLGKPAPRTGSAKIQKTAVAAPEGN